MKIKIFVIVTILFCFSRCAIKRCKGKQCTVRMVHYHNGDEFRGVNLFTYLFKNKNPRYGWGFPTLVKDPNGIVNPDKNGYSKKSKAYLKVIKPDPPKPEKAAESIGNDANSKSVQSSDAAPAAAPTK